MKQTNLFSMPKLAKKLIMRGIASLAVFALLSLNFPTQSAQAAALTTASIRVSRQLGGLTSGISLTAFWTPTSTATENKFQIIFPDGDDGLWCRSNGSLTLATTSIDSASDPTASAGTCTAGTGPSSYDTFDFTTTNLTPATLYGIVITGSTAVMGTAAAGAHVTTLKTRTSAPADIDTLSVAATLNADDQVDVSATIDPTLTVTVTPLSSVSLGTLSSGAVNQISLTDAVVTNAPNGYVSTVLFNNTLTSGSNTIGTGGISGGTVSAGDDEFGASTNDTTSVDLSTTSNSCASGAGPYNATTLLTTPQVFGSRSVAGSATDTLCFTASVLVTQPAGTYTSTVTIVSTGKF